jgi:hypothetical protein
MKKHKQMAAKLRPYYPPTKGKMATTEIEGISKKINQFDKQCGVAVVKTEEFVGHFDENVLQRRVGRIELMPRLESLCVCVCVCVCVYIPTCWTNVEIQKK